MRGRDIAGFGGRLAPTPTGLLHLGHAATFAVAYERARTRAGKVLLRIDDLDPQRCRPEFVGAAVEDLVWLGFDWDGEPVHQSARRAFYLEAWEKLRDGGFIYPCRRSRRDVESAAAPHTEEPIFPTAWRNDPREAGRFAGPGGLNWRFRVPDGEIIAFDDRRLGRVARTAGIDFGDFLVWNRLDVPAYELATTVDDAAFGIAEIVRGEDLLTSTARQILLHRALESKAPPTFHTPLLRDAGGVRLAKRSNALAIQTLRARGMSPRGVMDLAKSALAGGIAPGSPMRGV